jgi:hypothetical protein
MDDGEFCTGILLGIVLACIFFYAVDHDAAHTKKRLEIGDRVCAVHGGLYSLDGSPEYTCKDGAEIRLRGDE